MKRQTKIHLFIHMPQLIIPSESNMKEFPKERNGQNLLKKRDLIETSYDGLKNIAQIEHSKNRSSTT